MRENDGSDRVAAVIVGLRFGSAATYGSPASNMLSAYTRHSGKRSAFVQNLLHRSF
ncbi:hypothetical protein [Methylophaga lonarensis]|uniref:hypothetical protein n=1 Tax=Methylophaga lonarensis TaxID=999151 RepID=UPI003D29B374